MNRRVFLAAICGTLGANLEQDFVEPWSVEIETGPAFEVWPKNPDSWDMPGVHVFAELPEQIVSLNVFDGQLFAFTETGIYHIEKDGSHHKIHSVTSRTHEQDVRGAFTEPGIWKPIRMIR